MIKEKRDYTDFDKFINAQLKKGTISFEMNERDLNEALKHLGIRRTKVYDRETQTSIVINNYPKESQTNHVREIMDKRQKTQKRIDKTEYYEKDRYHYRAKKGKRIDYKGRVYKGGQYIPKRFVNEWNKKRV